MCIIYLINDTYVHTYVYPNLSLVQAAGAQDAAQVFTAIRRWKDGPGEVTESSYVFGTKRDRRKKTVNLQRWEVAGGGFFLGWTVGSKETQTGSNSRRDGWVLSVEILLDFGVLRRRNAGSCTIVGFPPPKFIKVPPHTLLLIDNNKCIS